MTGRVLIAALPGDEVAARENLVTVTNAAPRARIRVACFRPLPPARRDRHDRIVVDVDAEMDRIARDIVEAFRPATGMVDHDALEVVVRFGAPRREVATEVDAFVPDVVVLFAPPPGDIVRRLRARWIRQTLASRAGVRVLVVDMPRALRRRALRAPAPVTS